MQHEAGIQHPWLLPMQAAGRHAWLVSTLERGVDRQRVSACAAAAMPLLGRGTSPPILVCTSLAPATGH